MRICMQLLIFLRLEATDAQVISGKTHDRILNFRLSPDSRDLVTLNLVPGCSQSDLQVIYFDKLSDNAPCFIRPFFYIIKYAAHNIYDWAQ